MFSFQSVTQFGFWLSISSDLMCCQYSLLIYGFDLNLPGGLLSVASHSKNTHVIQLDILMMDEWE